MNAPASLPHDATARDPIQLALVRCIDEELKRQELFRRILGAAALHREHRALDRHLAAVEGRVPASPGRGMPERKPRRRC